ncbi:amino acid/polyamine transporter I [Aspergillus pseudonomiae]|uniref:Amino acid/polyamine transporter I n=1 Tax=Aspergillus pseudonomiae TaxID=1506151 RepID=A0A5N7DTQ1_9EURO|nr:amino acid/polyamine transporter I [Aspergillus pseudonomiae]KAB8263311.1 amino acid/polyamine transporter I [Aspergillus pseudonomiae]KAE8409851.1 amino acid/polyamine transporter I [Aspergillus pseudonomiae]
MQEEIEMKSEGAVRSWPVGSGNGGYQSATMREKQQLERYLNFFSSVAFSACLLATWESAGGSLLSGLYNGGPAAIVYGIILSTIGNLAIACSLAELASLHPTAGAQYHWSYFLAPRGRRFISFFQGWVTVFSWSALVCIAPYFIGTQIQGMVVLAHPDYELVRWRGTLLMWAVAIIPIIINIFARRVLGAIEVAAGIMHVVFLPVTIAVFVILAPRNPDSFVWNTFVGGLSGWKDSGVVFSIGLLGVITPLAGVDGVIHMAEEVKNAKVVVPRSMIYGTMINGTLAFAYLIAVLYCMGDYTEAVLSPTGYPIITIAYQATGSKAATFVLMAMGMLPGWIALFNGLASVTRLTWAFARDNGLPFSDFFARVDPTYKIPLRALFLVVSCIFALSFIQIGSTAAFNAILSLSTLGLYISYLIPLILLVFKRFAAPQDIPQGTFTLGKWGLPMNLLAILFATYFVIFLPFPSTLPVTAENMNYAGPVLGFVMLFACGDWIVRGRHKWEGPTMRPYARDE